MNLCGVEAARPSRQIISPDGDDAPGIDDKRGSALPSCCGGIIQRCSGPVVERRKVDKNKQRAFKGGAGMARDLHFDLPALADRYKYTPGKTLGILSQAIHLESKQRRAILKIPKKSVPQQDTLGDQVVKDVRQRLEALLKLDHVNVLPLHEACEDARSIYLVYEWPEGGMMLEHLTSFHEDVTEAHLASVARECLAAISAAASFSLHHLDWSLLCIFLGYKDRFSPVKVFGFGLAGVIVPFVTTRKVSRSNKHFYASPELFSDNPKNLSHHKLQACDVWSVGTLVYMLFSGRPPFYGPYKELAERVKKGIYSFGYEFDMVSREVKDAIEKMLSRKVENRPSASDLLKHPFVMKQICARKKEGVVCQDALTKLDQFAKETHCKQTLSRLLADLGLQESMYSELEEKFKQLDLDGNGLIEVNELCEVAATLPDSKDSEAVSKSIAAILKTCDRNENSTVDISEFVSAVVLHLEQNDERLLEKAFEKMDANRDARITKGELFKVLKQYSASLNPEEVTGFVKDMDKDSDQKIDYNEFKHLFPAMKDRDDEAKANLRHIRQSSEDQKKVFATLQKNAEKFVVALKVASGSLAVEYSRMFKAGGNERIIAEKLKDLITLVKDFAGNEEDPNKKAELDRKNGALSGLKMMHRYGTTKDDGLEKLTMKARENESGSGSGSESDHGPRKTVNRNARGNEVEVSNEKDPNENALTVIEDYMIRNWGLKSWNRDAMKKLCNFRRRHLWLGGGDGFSKLRTEIQNQFQACLRLPTGSRVNVAGNEGSDHEHEHEQQEEDHEIDEAHVGVEIKPWTTNSKKYKATKVAMELSGGARITVFGPFEDAEAAQKKFDQLGKQYLYEFHLSDDGTKELVDIEKLIRHKCCRSWLPRLGFWVTELKHSLDEQRVHVHERRKTHLDCIKHVMQTCERVMLSLCDLLCWQEESIRAFAAIEDLCMVPPATKRYLPFRGDLDEDARTPRDEEDVDLMASAEIEKSRSAFFQASQALDDDGGATFGEDNVGLYASQSAANLAASTVGDFQAGGLGRQPLLNRASVRMDHDPKVRQKIADTAKQQAMSMHF
eukprot:TRINITY_DN63254_c0_g1_i1.p1 TRINITY_DN63254_c0_g1~~TRINITY_DN63254_c0_g1_i1.p1  ORF type:complete len:1070 (+),score=251.66 TRINITY_DN63254_c0_g1_i1:123-3332(+)